MLRWRVGAAVCFTGEVSRHCHFHGHAVTSMGRTEDLRVRTPLIPVIEGLIDFITGFECCCALHVKEVKEAAWVSEGQTQREEQVSEHCL